MEACRGAASSRGGARAGDVAAHRRQPGVATGLLVESLVRVAGIDPGFRPEHLLTVTVTRPDAHNEKTASAEAFYRLGDDDEAFRRLEIAEAEMRARREAVLAPDIWRVRGRLFAVSTNFWDEAACSAIHLTGPNQIAEGHEP